MKALKEASPNVDITEKLVEDMKVRTCFVTTLERSGKLGTAEAPTPPPSVKYPGVKNINIPGEVREKAFEALWERDNDNLSIPTMILDAILQVRFEHESCYSSVSFRYLNFNPCYSAR